MTAPLKRRSKRSLRLRQNLRLTTPRSKNDSVSRLRTESRLAKTGLTHSIVSERARPCRLRFAQSLWSSAPLVRSAGARPGAVRCAVDCIIKHVTPAQKDPFMTDQTPIKTSARSGGRAARRAARAAPLDAATAPDPRRHGGRALQAPDACRCVKQSTRPLWKRSKPSASAMRRPLVSPILTGAGAILGDDGRIRFPRALVEDMLGKAANLHHTLWPRASP